MSAQGIAQAASGGRSDALGQRIYQNRKPCKGDTISNPHSMSPNWISSRTYHVNVNLIAEQFVPPLQGLGFMNVNSNRGGAALCPGLVC